MANKTIYVDVKVVESLLDLPEEMAIASAIIKDGKFIFEVETDLEMPDNGTLIYDADENGTIALIGVDELL